MPRAVDLFKQGRNEELWQMCCGFLKLNTDEFMEVQERLLMEQLELLNKNALGRKIMRGARPQTMNEFRQLVPLTTYKDYCPELLEKREETLAEKPALWVHSSGWSGEYQHKWIPMSTAYAEQLSKLLYGIGILSGCEYWGDVSHIPDKIKILYAVAPRPYISGTFADLLRLQSPFWYLPPLEKAEDMAFDERIKLGVFQAMSQGFDYFFGLSLILANVGEKIRDSSGKLNLRPFLFKPRSLWRLGRGKVRSHLAGRPMLPRDLWSIKGIIGSGVDSLIYKEKVKELWGRYPLDLYSCTEGGVIATQTWDYDGMTFFPNLNLLEFIPEDEQLKLQMDPSYQPKTLLLDEVEAGKKYEIIITNFHGGALVRYRIGDMIRITALKNEKLGINIPQMAFERRVDGYLNFYVVAVTEQSIWKAIESTGVAYEDWVAYKDAETLTLNIGIELKDGNHGSEEALAAVIYDRLVNLDDNGKTNATSHNDLEEMADFGVKIDFLPKGTFTDYIARKKAEGADPAHLKPAHINPSEKALALLTAKTEKTIVVTRSGVSRRARPEAARVTIS
jgi:hypothetical protein